MTTNNEAFQKVWPTPKNVRWDEALHRYIGYNPRQYTGFTAAAIQQQIKFNCWCDGYKAAQADSKQRIAELEAHINRLREAIEEALSTYQLPITARLAEALSETPAQSLKEHNDAMLDRYVQAIINVGGKRVYDFVDAVKSVSDSGPSKEDESMS